MTCSGSRVRVNATLAPTRWLSDRSGADARVAARRSARAAPFKAAFDVRTASPSGQTQRDGRDRLAAGTAFGEQRLVGVSWLNAARTFDGGRATIRSKRTRSTCLRRPSSDPAGEWDRAAAALSAPTPPAPPSSKARSSHFFWRPIEMSGTSRPLWPRSASDGGSGGRQLPGRLDYSVEAARQFSSRQR
jgi:hypothetical protein